MKKRILWILAFLIASFIFLNPASAQDLTISTDTIWLPGTYTYDNVTITNSAVLTCNGAVTLNAQNLTIDSGSYISSDAKGYPASSGPGTGAFNNVYGGGAGYGGKGGDAWDIGSGLSGAGGSSYGSSLNPTDLGSGGGGGNGGKGAGAIRLIVSNNLSLNGKITSNGEDGKSITPYGSGGGGSGGSIYITAQALSGSGLITANGGIGGAGSGGGSGGRIAVYYKTSSFTGTTEAKGAAGNQNGEDGTIAFIDQQNNIFYTGRSFRFQENDSPFNFTKVILNNSQVASQGNISLTTEQLLLTNSSFSLDGASLVKVNAFSLQNSSSITLNDTTNLTVANASTISNSSLTFTGAQALSIPSLTLDNSTLTLSGKETLSLTSLTLNNNSTLTHSPQVNIDLKLTNLTLDASSSITSNNKGYPFNQGPGTGAFNNVYGGGAGYGGKGGDAWDIGSGLSGAGGSSYGSSLNPTDLGSGGGGGYGGSGGGAIKLIISNNLTLSGKITSNGEDGKSITPYGSGGGGSGGSIYITAQALSGSGLISANGGIGGAGSGGGSGGRIAVYYKTSSFTGTPEAKGAAGNQNGEDGTVVFQPLSLDTPLTTFNLIETSSTTSTYQETLSTQELTLNTLQITGDLTGTLNFTKLTFTTLTSGAFSGKGFLEAEFQTTLEGASYQGTLQGLIYPDPKENKLHLKASISGLLINGIAEATLTESTPGSGVYDKYQATWKLNRLSTDTLSATLNLKGTVSSQSSHSFTSGIYLYQANFEGNTIGSYTGPLSAVLTHLRLTSENEYKGKGFSFISYNSLLGQGEGYSYNNSSLEGLIDFQGLFQAPLLGKLQATLDETKSPKTLSGTIERLDLGIEPMADVEVVTWGPTRVSPGQTVDYLIEVRNDGLIATENTTIIFSLDPNLEYVSSTYSYHNEETNEVIIDELHTLEAKGRRIIRVTAKVAWGLPMGTALENETRIGTTSKEKDLSTIDRTSWRNNIQPGDIILEHNENSKVRRTGYWTHGGGIVYGSKDDWWTGGREGYFVVEPLPGDKRHNQDQGGVRVTPIENWDYPFKKEVVILRATNLTQEQKTYVTNFWKNQIGKSPYQDPILGPSVDANENSNEWYCSELIWAPFHILGIEFNTSEWDIGNVQRVTPTEIYNSSLVTQVPGGYFNYKNLNINIHITSTDVVTAHDPNEKLVSPTGNIRPSDSLTYTINYENEGEGIAFGVYITDTLEEDLDTSSLTINNNGVYDPETRTITWFIGELASKQKGSVTFSINAKADLIEGAEVINFATVFFPSVPEATRTNGTVNRVTTATDTTPPITQATPSPQPNQSGWNNSAVTITLTAQDNEGGSGVSKTEYSLDNTNWTTYTTSFTITTEGTTTVYYKSTDNLNNTESTKSLEIKLDKTPPTITAQTLPQPNSLGWNNSDVTVTFTATDTLSGVSSVTQPQIITTEGANQIIGGQAIDLAINSSSISVTLNIDKTPPEVIITTPQEQADYLLNQNILADWSVSDYLSGIASATGTTPSGSGLDTSIVGTKVFNVTCLDNAGNKTDKAATYSVRYNYSGILPPINPYGSSIFKLGRTVPVKFQLKDSSGSFISTAVAKLYLAKISNDIIGTEVEAESVGEANTGNLFRYDTTNNQYIFNLGTSTLSEGTWQIRIALDDETSKYVNVGMR